VVLFLAALAVPATAGAAGKVPFGFFGATVDGPMLSAAVDPDAELGTMTASGVESVLAEFGWAVEQPTADRPPDFARTDRIVLAAARRGISVLAVVVYAPGWAAVDPTDVASPPRPAAYATFLTQLVARYGPRGSLWAEHPDVPRHPVRDWQVWNEPSHEGFWSRQPFARDYVTLLKAAHRALRAADPGARVILAGLVYKSWDQLEELYAAGARGSFDAISLHPYTRRLSDLLTVLRRNRRTLDDHGDEDVPMLVTELSWPSSQGTIPSRYGFETTPAGQAAHLRAALPRLARERRALGLERVYWFSWMSYDADPAYPFDYAGLRRLTPTGAVV